MMMGRSGTATSMQSGNVGAGAGGNTASGSPYEVQLKRRLGICLSTLFFLAWSFGIIGPIGASVPEDNGVHEALCSTGLVIGFFYALVTTLFYQVFILPRQKLAKTNGTTNGLGMYGAWNTFNAKEKRGRWINWTQVVRYVVIILLFCSLLTFMRLFTGTENLYEYPYLSNIMSLAEYAIIINTHLAILTLNEALNGIYLGIVVYD